MDDLKHKLDKKRESIQKDIKDQIVKNVEMHMGLQMKDFLTVKKDALAANENHLENVKTKDINQIN